MDKKEARRLMRSSMGSTLSVFDTYGLGIYIPQATQATIDAAEQFHKDMKEAESPPPDHSTCDHTWYIMDGAAKCYKCGTFEPDARRLEHDS